MTHIVYRKGDLFTTECDAIAHGVFVRDSMQTGFAKTLRETLPDVYEAFSSSSAEVNPGDAVAIRFGENRWVYNIISQVEQDKTSTELLEIGLNNMYRHARENGVSSIALPMIGSSKGDLSYGDSARVIEETAHKNSDVVTELWVH